MKDDKFASILLMLLVVKDNKKSSTHLERL